MKKPSEAESEYFVQREAERIKKLAEAKKAQLTEDEKERRKELHYMKCPKCGDDLQEILFKGVKVDICGLCNGMWLDDGELDQVSGEEGGFFKKFRDMFS